MGANKYPQPKKCPYCGRQLSYAYGNYFCVNYASCHRLEFNTVLKPAKNREARPR